MRSWIIGSGAECDVVVDSLLASARHCQLTQTPQGFLINDLGSTNGTYVNSVRIAGPIHLTRGDSITLGRTVPLPWPSELTRSIPIGRLADNEIVIDDPRVSGHHARLTVVAGFQSFIEDIGSSNGTFLNSADRRLTASTPISESDTLYFGTLAVPAARLLVGVMERPTAGSPPPPLLLAPRPVKWPAGLAALAALPKYRWLLIWMVQAPAFAIVISWLLGRPASAATWPAIEQRIASTTFALALAAVWLGCSLALVESARQRACVGEASADPSRFAASAGKRITVLASLCALACALLLAYVHQASGLKGPWLTMWGVLTMSSLVGLFLGLAVSVPVRNGAAAAALLVVCFAAMVMLGGRIQPVPQMNLTLRYAAEAMPSRWAFEGLFLLEALQYRAHVLAEEVSSAPNRDLMEGLFPADSERMGVRADALALGSMMIGLAALSAFISAHPRVCR